MLMEHSRRIAVSVLIALILIATTSYAKERYAVLVGVGHYYHLDENHQLKGPANDVQLARNYLLSEGFDEGNIYWLADDAPVLPERANILNALEELDTKVQPGDFVLLHFSGHGSRQPAKTGDTEERDGYDEIFLPADADKWDEYVGSVENAITDNELGRFISSYRRKGCDVWLIADSCHSGTMTRGAGDDSVVERYTDPFLTLGVPVPEPSVDGEVSAFSGIEGPAMVDEYQDRDSGMLIAFSAAHTSERAPEMLLRTGTSDPQEEVRGLLSHHIFGSLSRFPGVSYRQLAQLVTDQYSSMPWSRSTPQFYGSDMDRVVFNGSDERATLFAAVRDAESTRLKVEAGTLRGFAMGARVALHEDAHDVDENLIGSGMVVAATATESDVDAEWGEDAEVPRHGKRVYVRLTVPAYSSQVVIGRLDTKHTKDNERLREIIAAVAPDVPLVEFADHRTDADYHAAFFEDRFWLLRRGQPLPCEHRKEITSEDCLEDRLEEEDREEETLLGSHVDGVRDLITKAARARTLTKLQQVVGLPGDLIVDVQVQRTTQDAPISRSDDPGPLHPGDRVGYSIENDGKTAWDVFFFYVNSQLGITALQTPGQSVRLLPGEVGKGPGERPWQIDDSTLGTESLVVIADPVRRVGGAVVDAVEADYSFLAQETHRVVRAAMKGKTEDLEDLLVQATLEALWANEDFPKVLTRGMGSPQEKAQIRVFTWTVERK